MKRLHFGQLVTFNQGPLAGRPGFISGFEFLDDKEIVGEPVMHILVTVIGRPVETAFVHPDNLSEANPHDYAH